MTPTKTSTCRILSELASPTSTSLLQVSPDCIFASCNWLISLFVQSVSNYQCPVDLDECVASLKDCCEEVSVSPSPYIVYHIFQLPRISIPHVSPPLAGMGWKELIVLESVHYLSDYEADLFGFFLSFFLYSFLRRPTKSASYCEMGHTIYPG